MSSIATLTMNAALDIATSTERIVPTEKLRCREPRHDPGGGGINVARAVHQLGGDALAVFPVGGMSGEMLCHLLKGEKVPHAAVPIGGITRESLAIVERQSGYQFHGGGCSGTAAAGHRPVPSQGYRAALSGFIPRVKTIRPHTETCQPVDPVSAECCPLSPSTAFRKF